MSAALDIRDIHSLKQPEALSILNRISRIEKKTFPTSEAFEFSVDLWRKKPNTRVLYAQLPLTTTTTTTTSAAAASPPAIIAYAVYVRMKGIALLHKVCVAEGHRKQGFGGALMEYIMRRLRKEGCQDVQLWVDEERIAARKLYARCGFKELEKVENYYGPGRTGIKMMLALQDYV